MIFVTVGTQFGFDRLIQSLDNWALGKDIEIFAQISDGNYVPKNFEYSRQLNSFEYSEFFSKSSLVISHAGMGTIISCLTAHKPIILFPRLYKYGEHRNDHQLATVVGFKDVEGCFIAETESQLIDLVEKREQLSGGFMSPYASHEFEDKIKAFIDNKVK